MSPFCMSAKMSESFGVNFHNTNILHQNMALLGVSLSVFSCSEKNLAVEEKGEAIQEISNSTHVPRTPKKPEYRASSEKSQLT